MPEVARRDEVVAEGEEPLEARVEGTLEQQGVELRACRRAWSGLGLGLGLGFGFGFGLGLGLGFGLGLEVGAGVPSRSSEWKTWGTRRVKAVSLAGRARKRRARAITMRPSRCRAPGVRVRGLGLGLGLGLGRRAAVHLV